jgi:hypothetical protein
MTIIVPSSDTATSIILLELLQLFEREKEGVVITPHVKSVAAPSKASHITTLALVDDEDHTDNVPEQYD